MIREEIFKSNINNDKKYEMLMELKHKAYITKTKKSYKALNDFIPKYIKYTGEVFK